jgi:hypothetical protein
MKELDQRLFDRGFQKEREELDTVLRSIPTLLMAPGENIEAKAFAQLGPRIGLHPWLAPYFRHLAILTDRRLVLVKISLRTGKPGALALDARLNELSILDVKPKRTGLPLSLSLRFPDETTKRLHFSAAYVRAGTEIGRRIAAASRS